ncbi:MAG: ECF-type sigma factor [Gemmataceae bacterium]|nr:ECF-type sigma factor [Gemmataceae bacterium]
MDNNPPAHSVTHWIDALKRGDDEAAAALWRRYFDRLVRLAQAKLGPAYRRAADEEDVALSAFRCLCEGAARGRFTELTDRDDLWRLLTVLTVHKVIDQKRRESGQKRGGGEVRGESAFDDLPSEGQGLDRFLSDEPTPETLAILAEEHDRLLAALGDEALRQVALCKLEGFTNQEIAERLGVTCRSVERKLQRIRSRWLGTLTP